jgi:hypothetical protein
MCAKTLNERDNGSQYRMTYVCGVLHSLTMSKVGNITTENSVAFAERRRVF